MRPHCMREHEFSFITALCSLGSTHTPSFPPSLLPFPCRLCTTKCSCFNAQGYMLEAVGEISPSGQKAHISRLSYLKGKEGQQYLEIPNSAEEELKMMANGSIRPEKEWGTGIKYRWHFLRVSGELVEFYYCKHTAPPSPSPSLQDKYAKADKILCFAVSFCDEHSSECE